MRKLKRYNLNESNKENAKKADSSSLFSFLTSNSKSSEKGSVSLKKYHKNESFRMKDSKSAFQATNSPSSSTKQVIKSNEKKISAADSANNIYEELHLEEEDEDDEYDEEEMSFKGDKDKEEELERKSSKSSGTSSLDSKASNNSKLSKISHSSAEEKLMHKPKTQQKILITTPPKRQRHLSYLNESMNEFDSDNDEHNQHESANKKEFNDINKDENIKPRIINSNLVRELTNSSSSQDNGIAFVTDMNSNMKSRREEGSFSVDLSNDIKHKRRGTRSKSIFANNPIKNNSIKRRTIIEVIRDFDNPIHEHESEVNNQYNTHFTNISNLDEANENGQPVYDNNDYESETDSQENSHTNKKKKGVNKISVGLSIVYGMFLFLLGVFLCLDTYAGSLGTNRTALTVFFCLLYTISIVWIIFLFVDIKKYVNDLSSYIENQSDEPAELDLDRKEKGFYGIIDPSTNKEVNIYDTAILKEKTYEDKKEMERNKRLKEKLFDFEGKNFSGYLVDNLEPYNMYLKAGIGIFCIVTLLQCCVVVAESFENLSQITDSNVHCVVDMHEGIISGFQFFFTFLQCLFIFLYGNIVICKKNVIWSLLVMHIAITNLIVWFRNILLETIDEYYELYLEERIEEIESLKPIVSTTYATAQNTITNAVTTLGSTIITAIQSTLSSSTTQSTQMNINPITNINPTIQDMLETTTENHDLDYSSSIMNNAPKEYPALALFKLASSLFYSGDESENDINTNITSFDCHDPDKMYLKTFLISYKKYMYPASIEFSITMSTLFVILWYKIGKNKKCYTLPPTRKLIKGIGKPTQMPYSNLFIILDCTKTAKGIFFGGLIFMCTIISSALFMIYNSKPETKAYATLMSEVTEIAILIVALGITIYAFLQVRIHYAITKPQLNMFDVVLEIFSLFGVYAFSINSLIALLYKFGVGDSADSDENFKSASPDIVPDKDLTTGTNAAAAISSVLQMVQATVQTLLILECLRRYALQNGSFLHKPARELITALLLTNVSLWFFDTLSAKRFESKPFLIEHFGTLKWSIINAFSSPIAIFYRFHSSVCLSDIWYGLYYGEAEHEEKKNEHHSA